MKWMPAARVATPLAAALALAGCGSGAKAPAPPPTAPVTAPAAAPVPRGPEVTIVALGDSLFAGYGLPSQSLSYPARLEAALRAKGINARVINAGVSGDTTADGAKRAGFVLSSLSKPPALVLVSLGGNDMLRALPPAQTRANLDALLGELAAKQLPVLVLGMLAPPNLGPAYAKDFDAAFPAAAKAHHAHLIPLWLTPLLGHPEWVQADHLHPTPAGVEVLVKATIGEVEKDLSKQ